MSLAVLMCRFRKLSTYIKIKAQNSYQRVKCISGVSKETYGSFIVSHFSFRHLILLINILHELITVEFEFIFILNDINN